MNNVNVITFSCPQESQPAQCKVYICVQTKLTHQTLCIANTCNTRIHKYSEVPIYFRHIGSKYQQHYCLPSAGSTSSQSSFWGFNQIMSHYNSRHPLLANCFICHHGASLSLLVCAIDLHCCSTQTFSYWEFLHPHPATLHYLKLSTS